MNYWETTLAILAVLQLVVRPLCTLHSSKRVSTKFMAKKNLFHCSKCLILSPIYCKILHSPDQENEQPKNIYHDKLKFMIRVKSPPIEVLGLWNRYLSSPSYKRVPLEVHESTTASLIRYFFGEVGRLPYSSSQISHVREALVDSITRTAFTDSTCNVLLLHFFESGTTDFVPRIVSAATSVDKLTFKALAILINGYGNRKDMSLVNYYYNLRQDLTAMGSSSSSDSIQDEVVLHNAYLKALFLNGREELAMQTFASQIERNETDFYTFNTALAHFEKARKLNECHAIWMAVKAYYTERLAQQRDSSMPFGLELSVSLMVKSYLFAGEVAKAKDLIEEFPCCAAVYAWLHHLAWKAKNVQDVLLELEDTFGGEKYPRLFDGARKVKLENRLVSSSSFLVDAIVSGLSRKTKDASQAIEAYVTVVDFFTRYWSTYSSPDSTIAIAQYSSSPAGHLLPSPALIALSEALVSNITVKAFNIILNSVKRLDMDFKSPAAINAKLIHRSAAHTGTKNPFKIYIYTVATPELRRIFKDAILSRLDLHSLQQQYCDGYTLATALDFATMMRDPSLAERVWSKRQIIFTASHAEQISFERLYNAYLRSFRSKSQLVTLQRFVYEQFGIKVLHTEEALLVVDNPLIELHRHSSISDRTADELVNAFLRVSGLTLALVVANSLLDSNKAGGRIRIFREKSSDKIMLESSILNLAIAFDRRWRDSTQYPQDEKLSSMGLLLHHVEQLTSLIVSSRRCGPRGKTQDGVPKRAVTRREHLVWAAILAALLSRLMLGPSRDLVMKMEAVGESDVRPSLSAFKDGLVAGQRRVYDVKEVVKVVELAVFSALDGSLPLLTESALTVLSKMQIQNVPTAGLASPLELCASMSPRLSSGELRTIANTSDIIAFLQLLQPLENNSDGLKEMAATHSPLKDGAVASQPSAAGKYHGPIGVSLLETLFYECVAKKNLASAVKVVRLLEFCRLVIDVDQPMRLMQTAAKVAAAEEEGPTGPQAERADYFEVDQADDKSVRVYLARKWTALLLARSLKTLRSRVLSKSIHLLGSRNSLDNKNST